MRPADTASGRRNAGTDHARPTDRFLVLMADDEDYFVVARYALKARGSAAKLVHLHDGRQLLDHRSRGPRLPALILLDIRLPGMDGYSCAAFRWCF